MKTNEFVHETNDAVENLSTDEGNVYVDLDGSNYLVIAVQSDTETQSVHVQVNPMPVLYVDPAPVPETDNVIEGEE